VTGTYCDAGACVAFPGESAACNASRQCAAGLYCADAGVSPPGWCLATLDAGSVCSDLNSCPAGTSCDGYTGTCVAPCNPFFSSGCPDGARDLSIYLFYAAVVAGARGVWWKRRNRQARGRAPADRTNASSTS
jgi:hypothetical protein